MTTTLALLHKQIKDSLCNFQALMVMLIYPLVAFVMITALGSEDGMSGMFVTMFATMHASFAPLVTASNILSEEKEKGTLRALIMTGVSRRQYLMSVSLFVVSVTLLTGSAFLVMDAFTREHIAAFAAAMLCGAVLSTLAGLCVGIVSRNVSAANGMAVPIGLVTALLPMLARFNESLDCAARYLYSGQISRVLDGGELTGEFAAIMAAYAVLLTALLAFLFKKKGLE